MASVIDPGMAPLMGLAAGLVVEMGGTLSRMGRSSPASMVSRPSPMSMA